MNVGVINGGSAKNSVAASCNVFIDFRIVKEKHINEIQNKIEELSKMYNCTVKIVECIESFINDTDLVSNKKTTNFITEASLINKKETPDVVKIVLGPGPITAHEVNENISVESLNKLVEDYKGLILRACK